MLECSTDVKAGDIFPAGEQPFRNHESSLSYSQNTLMETCFARGAELVMALMTNTIWLQKLSRGLDSIASHGIGKILGLYLLV